MTKEEYVRQFHTKKQTVCTLKLKQNKKCITFLSTFLNTSSGTFLLTLEADDYALTLIKAICS